MKKCIKIAILLIMFLLLNTFSVFAADGATVKPEVILTPSATTAKVGDTFTITVVAKSEKTIEGFDAILAYDKTKLEFTNQEEVITSTGEMSGIDGETGEFVLTKLASSTTEGELKVATLSFKVLDNVEVGEELLIKLLNIQVPCTDVNTEDANIGEKEVKLTVAAEKTPELEPEPEPEPEPDPGMADKPINDAGLTDKTFIITLSAIVVGILYIKYRKYRDVK